MIVKRKMRKIEGFWFFFYELPRKNRGASPCERSRSQRRCSHSAGVRLGVFQQPLVRLARADYGYGTASVSYSVAVGDFNGDGKLDVAVADYNTSAVSALLGNGDGTFQVQVEYATGTFPHGVAVGEFNGDGKLDLAVANSGSNNVSVLW